MNLKRKTATLLVSVFVIAVCGILYELLISTISSYFQGSSVLHFSIVIGLFLSFMGVGSWASKYIKKDLAAWFVRFEIILSIVGGFSAFLLYFAFSLTPYFYGFAFFIIGVIGAMIGLEIPILTRIINGYGNNFKNAIADVLSFDYLGSLLASVAFPLLLLPQLGTMRTAFFVGAINLAVAISNTLLFKKSIKNWKNYIVVEIALALVLITGFIYSFEINRFYDSYLYRDQIIYSKQSKYQNIVVTKWNKDLRLFINGNLQFSTKDEYRYHEALVHLPMQLSPVKERVLILGGGDGLATKEILKYKDVQHIDLVDLDPAITEVASTSNIFTRINEHALSNPKVHIHNTDAFNFIEQSNDTYNVIIIDLPDPSSESLSKLYSQEFYTLVKKILAADGTLVNQSTSPYFAPDAFWCIHNTMQSVFPTTYAYKTYVPTFGMWGFNIAFNDTGRFANQPTANAVIQQLEQQLNETELKFRYLNAEMLPSLFQFPEDRKHRDTPINQLQSQPLVRFYEKNWDAVR